MGQQYQIACPCLVPRSSWYLLTRSCSFTRVLFSFWFCEHNMLLASLNCDLILLLTSFRIIGCLVKGCPSLREQDLLVLYMEGQDHLHKLMWFKKNVRAWDFQALKFIPFWLMTLFCSNKIPESESRPALLSWLSLPSSSPKLQLLSSGFCPSVVSVCHLLSPLPSALTQFWHHGPCLWLPMCASFHIS